MHMPYVCTVYNTAPILFKCTIECFNVIVMMDSMAMSECMGHAMPHAAHDDHPTD